VIGEFTAPGRPQLGLQLYAPDGRNICSGDSGGPMLISQNGALRLVAINILSRNNCADFSGATVVGYFRDWIRGWAQDLGAAAPF
jgi:secreted trypsin-like serine protease